METEIIYTLICSFFCSAGFSVIFHISYKELPIAGAVGVVTRAALLIAQQCTDNRLVFTMAAAVVGAFTAFNISQKRYTTTTKFLYPAFVPIIPGDLLYHTVVAFVSSETADLYFNLSELSQALLGLALGAMIVPVVYRTRDYWRQLKKVKLN